MESFTKEVGLILPVFLRTLPDMLRDKWPSNENHTLCVIWSQIERHRFAVICATPGTCLTTELVTNFSRNIIISFSSRFSISATILSKVLWVYHYMILRQFARFNHLLIPSYQLTHPSLPASFQSLTGFWRLLRSLDRFTLSVLISISKPFRVFLPSEWDFIDDPVWSISIFWKTGKELVCHTSRALRCSSRALRDDTKNGCVAD